MKIDPSERLNLTLSARAVAASTSADSWIGFVKFTIDLSV